MIITHTDVVSGATPQQIRSLTAGLAPARLADLAAELAADPGLRVSVITYRDGHQALEVLRVGPPRHTEHTIDRRRFTGPADPPAPLLAIATQPALQAAIRLIHDTLREASPPGNRSTPPRLRTPGRPVGSPRRASASMPQPTPNSASAQ